MFIHDNGVENVAVAMVKHTRHDYIVGGKILYRVFKRIPEWDELYNSEKYFKWLTSKDRETFMERIKAYAPVKDNIEFVCVRNTYIKSFTVRIKNI